jgi:ATP-binding cassette subfamily B protein
MAQGQSLAKEMFRAGTAASSGKRAALGLVSRGRLWPRTGESTCDARSRICYASRLKSEAALTPELTNTQLIFRLLGLTWRYRWGCLKVLSSQFGLLLTGIATVGLTGLSIDTLRHAVDPMARPPEWPSIAAPPVDWSALQTIATLAAAIFCAATLRLLLAYLNGVWFGELLQGRLVVDLRAQCYDKLQRLEFRFFDTNSSSSLINRVGGDVQNLRLFVDGVLFQIVTLAVSLAAFLGYMLAIHPGLTLACLGTTPLVWAASAAFSRSVRPAYKRASELFDGLVQRLAESIRGIRVIKSFAREEAEIERFARANDTLRRVQFEIFGRVTIFVPFIIFLSQANIIVLLGYGGWLAVRGEIGIGTGLVGFAAILQQFSGQIAGIGNIANSMQQCLRASQRVFEVLDAPLPIQSPEAPKRLRGVRGGIQFENVSFEHAGHKVLEDVVLDAAPGECIAIVGPTGSGKSALLSLIPRFYDATLGRVTLDGLDVRALDLVELRRSVGIVFQDNFLFSSTVAENIAFGHPEASREQIEKAASIASAHAFIMDLPQGYDTVLGEAGVGLSGGQKQRLAIARALLLEPAILLLDDPTAAVDPETEHEIVDAMQAAMDGRTTIIVAHRPAMLQRASRIYVLEQGRVVQRGSHAELLAAPGYYQTSAQMQGLQTGEERLP